MPTNRRRRRRRRRLTFTSAHALQLRCGFDFFNVAYGDSINGRPQPDLDLMRADWEEHRDEVIERTRARGTHLRPWAWWVFDHGYDGDSVPRGLEAEAAVLRKLGALTREDEGQLAQRSRRRGEALA